MRIWKSFLATLVLSASNLADATIIYFDVTEIDASTQRWQYDFTVENNTLAAAITEFTVFFELGQYANLTIVASPASWDSLVTQPDPALPDDGFFDSLALAGGIAPGATLGGFSVSFNFLGVGTPGPQSFDILDADFNVVDSGRTRPNGMVAVSAPGSLALFVVALLAMGVARRCHRSVTQAQFAYS
jgi:hypothetical protein